MHSLLNPTHSFTPLQAELNKGLDLVSSDIRIKRAELASLDARLAGAVEEEGAAAAALAGREARQQALFAKQGQRARYATAAERDEALTKEIRCGRGVGGSEVVSAQGFPHVGGCSCVWSSRRLHTCNTSILLPGRWRAP